MNIKFKLPSGNYMPAVGFGTFEISEEDVIEKVLDYALAAGYRHFDTAAVYQNETFIGNALPKLLQKYKLKRKDIFITSKLAPSDHGVKALQGLQNSIRNLKCEYLDLYLIHWPGKYSAPSKDPNNAILRRTSWENLVKGVRAGLVRDIGVSNYTTRHLQELLSRNFGVKPAVNQVEWHPYWHQSALKEFCDKENIVLQAYSSLGGSDNPNLIRDKTVLRIAEKLEKSTAQILLRWALQQNIAVLPKSRKQEHIEANIQLDFVIPEQEMQDLTQMQTGQNCQKYAWDPETIM